MGSDIKRFGKQIAIYIPFRLLELSEVARKKMGLNRSRFIQYCIMHVLQELSLLSMTVHEEGEKR